jgi:hypothetical protein
MVGMQNIATHVRHQLTFLAGLGGILLGWNLIAPEEVAAVNEAGAKLIDPLMIIAGAVAAFVGRMAISWVTGIFRRGAGEDGDTDSKPSGGMSALLLMTCAAGVLGGLPSCSMGEYPVTGSITFRDEASGAKAGLTFYPPVRKVRAEK